MGVNDGAVRVGRTVRTEDGACRHLLVWRAGPGWRMVSSAVLGGGLHRERRARGEPEPHPPAVPGCRVADVRGTRPATVPVAGLLPR
ncbi:hypothetical protein ACFWJ4_41455 [Kitasatospora sp. NPDC127067]|uniref:hypothetical protein n=1 Tax=Kitasatospora sp. NPDC127067 TaxID=3347126 RepID=UPI00365B3557